MVFRLRKIFYSIIVACFIALVSIILAWKHFLDTPLNATQSLLFYIPAGSSIGSIAHRLKQAGILSHPHLFIFMARLEGQANYIKAGEYQIDPGTTPHQLLIKMVEGRVFLRQFTIVEGWTLKQVLNSINSNPYLQHTLSRYNPEMLTQKFHIPLSNLEGYLYPDTYLFAAGVADLVIFKRAFMTMQKNLMKEWQGRNQDLPYQNPYSALIAASLIEKETARPQERSRIAGVIIRRLKKHMLLQIDASVIYGLGDEYTGKLSLNDLKKDTPFNTYLHSGLPPTPIAMPSLPSIIAALHPQEGSELYYVARGDGTHEFSDTLEKHHQAIHKYHVQHLEIYNPDKNIPDTDIIPPLIKNNFHDFNYEGFHLPSDLVNSLFPDANPPSYPSPARGKGLPGKQLSRNISSRIIKMNKKGGVVCSLPLKA